MLTAPRKDSGESLMLFRKFRNITQQEIAINLNTSQQYVSEVEGRKLLDDELVGKFLGAMGSDWKEWEKFKGMLRGK
jgi:hypothetical protein